MNEGIHLLLPSDDDTVNEQERERKKWRNVEGLTFTRGIQICSFTFNKHYCGNSQIIRNVRDCVMSYNILRLLCNLPGDAIWLLCFRIDIPHEQIINF
jgi:hypothetical protein